jgi:hypothetical protein
MLYIIYYILYFIFYILAAAKLEVSRLPNSGFAAAKLSLAAGNLSLAAAKLYQQCSAKNANQHTHTYIA